LFHYAHVAPPTAAWAWTTFQALVSLVTCLLGYAVSTTIDFVKNQTIKLQYKFDDVDSDTDGDALFLVYMNGRNILTLNDSQTTNGDWTGPYTLNTGNFESMAAVEISFVAISVGYDAGSFVYVDNLQIFN
jgi:hypothetical protein